jgi:hypothetical protein
MVLTKNSDWFPKQHQPVGFGSGDVTWRACFLWGTNWNVLHHLGQLRAWDVDALLLKPKLHYKDACLCPPRFAKSRFYASSSDAHKSSLGSYCAPFGSDVHSGVIPYIESAGGRHGSGTKPQYFLRTGNLGRQYGTAFCSKEYGLNTGGFFGAENGDEKEWRKGEDVRDIGCGNVTGLGPCSVAPCWILVVWCHSTRCAGWLERQMICVEVKHGEVIHPLPHTSSWRAA